MNMLEMIGKRSVLGALATVEPIAPPAPDSAAESDSVASTGIVAAPVAHHSCSAVIDDMNELEYHELLMNSADITLDLLS